MTRVKVALLTSLLESISEEDFNVIANELKTHLTELRELRIEAFEKQSYIGSISFGQVKAKMLRAGVPTRGPFTTESDFDANIRQRWKDATKHAVPCHPEPHKIVFTHGSLPVNNIMVVI